MYYFPLSDVVPFHLTTMTTLGVLGYANTKPCKFVLDFANPQSRVSASFLYRYSLIAKLDASGCQYAKFQNICPVSGGVFTTLDMLLIIGASGDSDVLLGVDWLTSCQITPTTNALQSPSRDHANFEGRQFLGSRW